MRRQRNQILEIKKPIYTRYIGFYLGLLEHSIYLNGVHI